MARQYYVYILTNVGRTVLYVGVTSDLRRRIAQHRAGVGSRFTARYRASRLVYYEVTNSAYAAISREKQLKAGSRRKKLDLIADANPEWRDLAAEDEPG